MFIAIQTAKAPKAPNNKKFVVRAVWRASGPWRPRNSPDPIEARGGQNWSRAAHPESAEIVAFEDGVHGVFGGAGADGRGIAACLDVEARLVRAAEGVELRAVVALDAAK